MLTTLVLLFYTSLFLSLLVTGKSPRIAQWIGAVDLPDERKAHQHAIPRLGGIGIAVALLLSLLLFVDTSPLFIAFVIGAIVISGTGLLDDALQISPIAKFSGQILAVLLFVFIGDVQLRSFGDLFGIGNIYLGSLSLPITVVCIVGVINALNLSDGLDGLAGGLSAIAVAFLSVLAFITHNILALEISIALFAAILGFLRYNSYPAKLFMGDTGSLLLGYVLAAIAIMLVQPTASGHPVLAPITIALVLALPIVDTVLVMSCRIYKGDSPFLPDKTHLHHRLMGLGFPHAAVVPMLYTIMVIMGAMAVLLLGVADWLQLLSGLFVLTLVYVCVSKHQQSTSFWASPFVRYNDISFHQTRYYQWMTAVIGKSVPWLLGFIVCALTLPLFFMRQLPDSIEYYALAIAVIFVVLFPWRANHGHFAIMHGLLYLASVSIVFALNMNQQAVSWIPLYLQVVSIIVLLWVALKLLFKRNTEIFLTSGFEVLLIFISWFIPMILLPKIQVSATLIHTLTIVCIEVIPFFLAFKIIVREQPRRNHLIAISMVFSLVLLAGKGVIIS